MKLRIKGNSIRLRLTRPEVAQLGDQGRVEEAIAFGPAPEDVLAYALVVSPDADRVHARRDAGGLTVVLPTAVAREWAATERVGVDGEQPGVGPGGAAVLRILVEKDFACLDHPEDDADAFPNPAAGSAC